MLCTCAMEASGQNYPSELVFSVENKSILGRKQEVKESIKRRELLIALKQKALESLQERLDELILIDQNQQLREDAGHKNVEMCRTLNQVIKKTIKESSEKMFELEVGSKEYNEYKKKHRDAFNSLEESSLKLELWENEILSCKKSRDCVKKSIIDHKVQIEAVKKIIANYKLENSVDIEKLENCSF